MSKNLNELQQEDLREWLLEMEYPAHNIASIYADGKHMAKLLNELYPHLIDKLCFSPTKTLSFKIRTWNSINLQVLVYLDLYQSCLNIENIARARPHTVEMLLWQIMQLQKANAGVKPESEDKKAPLIPQPDYANKNLWTQLFRSISKQSVNAKNL